MGSTQSSFLNRRGFATGYFYWYRPQTKLREGNVFTPVCDSVHKEGLWPWGGTCQGAPRTVTSGRYASYWNAFLFFLIKVFNAITHLSRVDTELFLVCD